MDVSPFSTVCHLPYWEGTTIWYFVCNLRAAAVENDTLRHTCVLQMLSEAPPICRMRIRKGLKHFISNGYLPLLYSIPFFILRGYPKSGNLCAIWESTAIRKGTLRSIGNMQMLSEAYSTCPMRLWKVLKHFISNLCLSFPYIITFAILRGHPKKLYFVYYLGVNHGDKWQLRPTCGWQMQRETPPITGGPISRGWNTL